MHGCLPADNGDCVNRVSDWCSVTINGKCEKHGVSKKNAEQLCGYCDTSKEVSTPPGGGGLGQGGSTMHQWERGWARWGGGAHCTAWCSMHVCTL